MARFFEYFKGRRELFMTYKIEALSKVINTLNEHNIKYYVFTRYDGTANRRTGAWVSIFERTEYETQYYVYVDKNSLEQARYVLKEAGENVSL